MKYNALVSSDWNECLAPCGPFDPISFAYPHLAYDLSNLFRQYTGNKISLVEATKQISALTPGPVSEEQMDAYLDARFATYRGVPALIEWCLSKNILFMLNTTGTQGYFQRAFAKKLLPSIPVVAANPLIRCAGIENDPRFAWRVMEVQDKAANTESVMRVLNIPGRRIIIIGDSGGDGPHFGWGASVGGFLIGSMTKQSLEAYCDQKGIRIDHRFGTSYSPGMSRDSQQEVQADFEELTDIIESFLAGSCAGGS